MSQTGSRYRAIADDGKPNGKSVEFVVTDSGHKQAWSQARMVCRTGTQKFKDQSKPILNPDGAEVEFAAGTFTVRSVFAIDRARGGAKKAPEAPKVLSAD